MKRLDGYGNLLFILPAAGTVVGVLYAARVGPVALCFAAFVALTLSHLYFAVRPLADRFVSGTLRGLLPFIALLWFLALPSANEWEVYRLRPGMTRARVVQTLRHHVPLRYPPGYGARTLEWWYPPNSNRYYEGVYLMFDDNGSLREILPLFG